MTKAKPEDLRCEAVPVLQAELSQRQVSRILPVDLEEIDPLAEPEPSVGALLRLDSGQLAAAVYGVATRMLLLHLPEDRVSEQALHDLLEEIPVPEAAVRWQHPETLPPSESEPRRAVAGR